MPPARVEGVERIAVLRANGLGDLIVAEPALAALRAAYPQAAITLLTSGQCAALLAGRPFPVDRVLAAPLVQGVRFTDGSPDDPSEVVEAFCARMRAERFDLAVQLHGGGGNANPLVNRFGARVTAGSRAPGAAPLDRAVTWTAFQHDVLRWLEVVGLVGARPVHLRPELAVTAADLDEADRALAGAGDAPLVALHPGATDPRRRWPPDRLAAVGDAVSAAGARPVLLGGAGDRVQADELRREMKAPAVDLAGALSLGGLVGVLARAALFVGNDSGPRHLAEAVGTATVGVFTKANLVDVTPLFRARHRVVVSWDSGCAVCGRDVLDGPCGHDATVLGDVGVAEVTDAALDLLRPGPA
jgi:ADP-heptose:LPS heptosyltransferase